MRVVLVILLVLLGVTVLVCLTSIAAVVSLRDGTFTWSVRYLGIKLMPYRWQMRGKKEKKKKKKAEKAETKRKFLMDKLWEMVQGIVGKLDLAGSGIAALPGPLQRLLRSIAWSDITTDFVIGGEDAADTARQYGIVQAALQTVIESSRHVIRVRRRDVRIRCDFTADRSRWDFSCKCKIQIGMMLGALIWLVFRFFADSRKSRKQLVQEVI